MVIVDGECVHVLYGTGCFSTKIIIREFLCQCQTWLPLPHHLPVKIMLSQKNRNFVERNEAGQYICDIDMGFGLVRC